MAHIGRGSFLVILRRHQLGRILPRSTAAAQRVPGAVLDLRSWVARGHYGEGRVACLA